MLNGDSFPDGFCSPDIKYACNEGKLVTSEDPSREFVQKTLSYKEKIKDLYSVNMKEINRLFPLCLIQW